MGFSLQCVHLCSANTMTRPATSRLEGPSSTDLDVPNIRYYSKPRCVLSHIIILWHLPLFWVTFLTWVYSVFSNNPDSKANWILQLARLGEIKFFNLKPNNRISLRFLGIICRELPDLSFPYTMFTLHTTVILLLLGEGGGVVKSGNGKEENS